VSTSAPRLSGGITLSLVLHGALVAAFFLVRPTAPPPEAPVYRVQLIAAPAGERAVGVVQEVPPVKPPTPAATPPVPVTPPKPTPVTTKVPATKTKPTPKLATPVPPVAKTDPVKPTTPPPVAGGGATGGKGADVANVETPGIEFPYPAYTQGIVREIIRRFPTTQSTLVASVRFIIRRDGTVDPETIQLVTRSGNYTFDERAMGAVESAANAKAFGPLPPGFHEDILAVTFRFSPTLIR
jgi:protein TonB